LPQRVYPQQKIGNKMYLMVGSNGDEFVFVFLKCKIVAMFLQFKKKEICCVVLECEIVAISFFNSREEKFVANLLCCFGVIDF